MPFAPVTSIFYKTEVFPLPSDVNGIHSTFLCYYVARLCDFDLLTLVVFDELSFTYPTHIPIFSILWFSVPELWVTQSDHISVIWNNHCACAVSRDLSLGAKMNHIFEIHDPNLPIHFVTFRAIWQRLSHVIVENSVYPIVNATKFTAHVQYHVTCA